MQRNSVLERDVQRYKERREIERQVRISHTTYGVPPNKCRVDRIASVNPPVQGVQGCQEVLRDLERSTR